MMNVCFFSGDITRNGGTERVAITLANALNSHADFNVSVLSLTESHSAPFFPLSDDIKRAFLSDEWINPGAGYLKILPKLRGYVLNNHIDAIIDIDIVLDVLSIPAAASKNTRVISWQHFSYEYEFKVLYRKIILKLFTSRTERLVTLTKKGAGVLGKYIRRDDVLCIPNPMPDIDYYCPFSLRKKQIITVGHLIPSKGINYLMELSKRILPNHPEWSWIVIGDGELEENLKNFAVLNKLSDNLIIAGQVSDVSQFYNSASIYVMTSLSEGLPMTLLEAKAYHVPSVAFDIATGPSDIIADGINGYIIPPFDLDLMEEKILNLMENENLRETFSSNALYGSEEFLFNNIIPRWISLLKDTATGI